MSNNFFKRFNHLFRFLDRNYVILRPMKNPDEYVANSVNQDWFPPPQMGTMAANLSGYLTASSHVPYPPILNPVR